MPDNLKNDSNNRGPVSDEIQHNVYNHHDNVYNHRGQT